MRGAPHLESIAKVLKQVNDLSNAALLSARINIAFSIIVKKNIFVRIYEYIISKLKRK